MRVLLGPRVDLAIDPAVRDLVEALAGRDGPPVSLRTVGVSTVARRLSAAEILLVRRALVGDDLHAGLRALRAGGGVVGYLCRGSGVDGRGPRSAALQAEGGARVIAVADHADLVWRSPLAGPNDDNLGPRFPVMTDVYAPGAVLAHSSAVEGGPGKGMMVVSGVVGGVRDDTRPTAYETDMATAQGFAAVSSELVPVAVLARHMGLRLAAAVLIVES